MRNNTILLAATLAAALSSQVALPQAALAQSAGETARNLLPMGGDTGHSPVDVRQGLVGGPIVTGRSRGPVGVPYSDPETTGSLRPHAAGHAGTWHPRTQPQTWHRY